MSAPVKNADIVTLAQLLQLQLLRGGAAPIPLHRSDHYHYSAVARLAARPPVDMDFSCHGAFEDPDGD